MAPALPQSADNRSAPDWRSPGNALGLAGGGRRFLLAALGGARAGFALPGLLVFLWRRFLGLGVLLPLLLRGLRTVHQLEDHHLGAIARTQARLHDAAVAAVALAEPGRDGVEELLHHHRVRHHRQHLPARMQILSLGQGDHVVGEAPHRLRLGLGGHDPLVPEERDQQVPEERPAVRGDASELEARLAVPHFALPRPSVPRRFGSMRIPRDSPSPASAALISSIDFSPRFFTDSRSSSVFWTRSATTMISWFFSALMARAGSGRSSSGLARLSCRWP